MNIYKIGTVELTEQEAERAMQSGYIVTFRSVYQIHHSRNAGYYGRKIYYADKRNNPLPLTKRGRFFVKDGSEVNSLIGFKLVNEQ